VPTDLQDIYVSSHALPICEAKYATATESVQHSRAMLAARCVYVKQGSQVQAVRLAALECSLALRALAMVDAHLLAKLRPHLLHQ